MDHWDPTIEPPKLARHPRRQGSATRVGDRVRLWPLGDADILDMAMKGKLANIAAIEQDFEDRVYLAVTVDDDPGQDMGAAGKPGHRFFYPPRGSRAARRRRAKELVNMPPRILIAGIGNIFLGDDAFGVEVVQKLAGTVIGPKTCASLTSASAASTWPWHCSMISTSSS